MNTQQNIMYSVDAKESATTSLLAVIAVAGAVTLGAYARIPLPAPFPPLTLQTLPVLLAGFVVGRNRATAGMLLYLLLGFAGVPVFASAFGPTVGYLLAFALVPWVVTRFRGPSLGIIFSTGLIYLIGSIWLAIWLNCSPWHAAAIGVLPFVPGDIVKAIVACRLAERTRAQQM